MEQLEQDTANPPEPSGSETGPSRQATSRRVGAAVAIIVNALLLYAAENVLDWDVFPFLTESYEQVLPAIRLTLLVTMGVNVLRLFYGPNWFAVVTDAISTAFGLYAAVRLFQVFPFDFSPSTIRWDLITRVILIVAIAGSVISILVSPLRLISSRDTSE